MLAAYQGYQLLGLREVLVEIDPARGWAARRAWIRVCVGSKEDALEFTSGKCALGNVCLMNAILQAPDGSVAHPDLTPTELAEFRA